MFFCFFFKQKTAYELRISDWSSDMCSSDLPGPRPGDAILSQQFERPQGAVDDEIAGDEQHYLRLHLPPLESRPVLRRVQPRVVDIGRASCRERVCQYV